MGRARVLDTSPIPFILNLSPCLSLPVLRRSIDLRLLEIRSIRRLSIDVDYFDIGSATFDRFGAIRST